MEGQLVEQLVAIPVLGVVERPVLLADLCGESGAERVELRARNHQRPVARRALAWRAAEAHSDRAVLELVARRQVDRAGGGEVALVGEVRALGHLDLLDHLRNDEVGVGEALSVGVRDHVHRDAVDRNREVGAVVGVEAAQEILVGLAAARVLYDHQPGSDAQDVLHAADRSQLKVAVTHRERRGGADRPLGEHHRGVDRRPGRGRRDLERRRSERRREVIARVELRGAAVSKFGLMRQGAAGAEDETHHAQPRACGRGQSDTCFKGMGRSDRTGLSVPGRYGPCGCAVRSICSRSTQDGATHATATRLTSTNTNRGGADGELNNALPCSRLPSPVSAGNRRARSVGVAVPLQRQRPRCGELL